MLGAGPLQNRSAVIAAADAAVSGEFTFIGETKTLATPDWSKRHGTPLWSFNFQYGRFIEDLAWAHVWTEGGQYLEAMARYVESWISQQKPIPADACAPYVVGRRLQHWSRAFVLTADRLAEHTREVWLHSIASQTDYLSRHLERHLSGNHVISNLVGAITGAALFGDQHFDRMLRDSFRQLCSELDAQVLADGVHYERSPLYHAIVLADATNAINIAEVVGLQTSDQLISIIHRMRSALERFKRADGTFHLFNDAANPDRPSDFGPPSETEKGTWALQDSGYFGHNAGAIDFIIDCGELGPRHQPAHAHCDLLSFELDLYGIPVVVDSGTSGYDMDPLRKYVRSTRAHNTVQIGEMEQHEMWATFRVARRGRVLSAAINGTRDSAVFKGAYSPYFSRRVVHQRTVTISRGMVTVEDRVSNAGIRRLRSFLHLHPNVEVRIAADSITLLFSGRCARIECWNLDQPAIQQGELDPAQGWYAPRFGERIPAPVLEFVAQDKSKPFGYRIKLD